MGQTKIKAIQTDIATSTTTMTNKTLTSPKINEDVALTSTSTELNALDGNMGAWTVYTPTIAASSGSYTTASANGRYIRVGKIVYFKVTGTITTIGTATGVARIDLPVTAKETGNIFIGREDGVTGVILLGLATTTTMNIYTYDNGGIMGSGYSYRFTGTYEAA